MCDPVFEFTVARPAKRGLLAAKRIARLPDGGREVRGYDKAWRWFLTRACCMGLEEMAAMLRGLARQPDRCILMGAVMPGLDTSKPHLRRWSNSDAATNSLVELDRKWLPIDVDGASVPAPLGRGENLVEAGTFVRDRLLPPEFAGIDCVVTPSARTGLGSETDVRLRLFFQLMRKHSLLDMRQWAMAAQAAGCPIDPVLFRGGHPVYTSRPLFTGLLDPVPEELYAVILPGLFGDSVDLVAGRFVQHIDQPTPVNRTTVYGGNFSSDWRVYLRQTVGGSQSFFTPLTAGLSRAAASEASESEIVAFTVALVAERTATDTDRRKHYSAEWIRKTAQRFRCADRKVDAEIARARARLFLQGMY